MQKWFETLMIYEQILWVISIGFSIVFFYQIFSTIIRKRPGKRRKYIYSGLISFKNLVTFLSVFGWVSISSLYQDFSLTTSLIIGAVSGIIVMLVMSVLFYYVQKAKENSKPEKPKRITTTGIVIEDIGKKRSKLGQIKIKIDGEHKTMDALTDFEHDLISGTKVRVESVTSSGIFIIKPMQ